MASAHVPPRCRLALARPRDTPGLRARTSPAASRDAPRVRSRRAVVMATPASSSDAKTDEENDKASFAIEVERKYDASSVSVETLRETVESLGGVTKGSVTFTDVYYDTPDAALAAKDTWLRARDGAWEIKVPLQGDERRSGGERSVFREVEGAGPCLRELNTALGANPEDGSSDAGTDDEAALAAAMTALGVVPFAEFTTRRAKFELDGASVDVDAASFGHAVCEVEVLCAYASQVPDAEAKVAYVAQRLGLTPLTDSGGKLETYIRRNCPTHVRVLVEAGYLKPEPARAPASKCAGG
uniref:CYTH domain-containing protein n=1 Tax=Micromonas pusilla TaxID=38833 RepID=A0A7S0KVG9_MICPS